MSITAKFIHRPVMAIILSLVLVFLGVLAMRTRPVSQFPEISPPRVMVSLTFPGASADVLVQSSLITLERAINGVPGMTYMISDATSAGEATIQVVFRLDADPNEALVNVKNRIDQVSSRLPALVQLEGVILNRVQPSMLMYVNLFSAEKSTDQKFLYNFANANLLPELSRVDGIAQTRILGSRQYAMRVWLNPDKMRAYKVSSEDVMKAISEQSGSALPGASVRRPESRRRRSSTSSRTRAVTTSRNSTRTSSFARTRRARCSASRTSRRSSSAASSSTSTPISTATRPRRSC